MKKPYKISIFEVIGDSSLTGAPKHLLTLVENINRHKFLVSVICPPGDLVRQLKKLKVTVFTVPMQGKADVNAVNAIAKLLSKYQPDILHTHGQRAGLVGRAASRGMVMKRIHTEHTYTHDFRLANPVWHWGHLRAMAVLDRFTDKTIAVSEAVKKFLVESHISKPSKVEVIYNGISRKLKQAKPTDIDEYRTKWGIAKGDLVIGTVGSLVPSKDTATLISAFAKVAEKTSKAKLVLIGAGPLKLKLEKLAQTLGIGERVVFAGSIEDVTSAIKTFDIFVLPSLSEAFGIVLLEAMQAGVPIIATRVGGIPEVVTNNLTGVLVEPKNPKKLSAAILKLLNDRRQQQKIVANYPTTLNKFTADKMTRAIEKVYQSVLS